MSYIHDNKKRLLAASILMLPFIGVMAQEAPASAPASVSAQASLEYLLAGLAAVLLVAVVILGNVFLKLVKINLEKSAKAVLIILFASFAAQHGYAQDAAPQATQAAGSSSAFLEPKFLIIAITLLLELGAIMFFLIKIMQLLKQLSPEPESKSILDFNMPVFWERVNASVAVEKEADILLDHNYDGIKELDNNLPPWWKYGFYFTIVWAFGYLIYYHMMGGPLSIEVYNAEMEEAKIQKAAFLKDAKNKVDENTVTMADAAGIADGKAIFIANCKACHGELGEGGVGPNLTDKYWIHGGDIKSVFKTVKYGVAANGMKAWESDLSPVQIQNVVSYVKSIGGTNPPNAKDPQGNLFNEGGENASAAMDSSAIAPGDTLTTASK